MLCSSSEKLANAVKFIYWQLTFQTLSKIMFKQELKHSFKKFNHCIFPKPFKGVSQTFKIKWGSSNNPALYNKCDPKKGGGAVNYTSLTHSYLFIFKGSKNLLES